MAPYLKKENRLDTQNSLLLKPTYIYNKFKGNELNPIIVHFNEASDWRRRCSAGTVLSKIQENRGPGDTECLLPADCH